MGNLFLDRYKEVKSDGSLFGINLEAIKFNRCPACGRRLYELLKGGRRCKSKNCSYYSQFHKQFFTTK